MNEASHSRNSKFELMMWAKRASEFYYVDYIVQQGPEDRTEDATEASNPSFIRYIHYTYSEARRTELRMQAKVKSSESLAEP